MDDTQPQSTLRELRAEIGNLRTLSVLVLIGGIATIAAPLGTDRSMTPLPRAAFWIGLVGMTYVVGLAVHLWMRPRMARRPRVLAVALTAVATGIATAIAVDVLTGVLFGWPDSLAGILSALGRNFAIGVCVSLGVQIATGGVPAPAAAAAPDPPRILDRLPPGKRGPLVSISVEDHYVRVRTTRGEDMLLLRLSDAIAETDPTPGLKVHRSHWVAIRAISAATRRGDGAVLNMTTGPTIPVSRANVSKLKDAGLL